MTGIMLSKMAYRTVRYTYIAGRRHFMIIRCALGLTNDTIKRYGDHEYCSFRINIHSAVVFAQASTLYAHHVHYHCSRRFSCAEHTTPGTAYIVLLESERSHRHTGPSFHVQSQFARASLAFLRWSALWGTYHFRSYIDS